MYKLFKKLENQIQTFRKIFFVATIFILRHYNPRWEENLCKSYLDIILKLRRDRKLKGKYGERYKSPLTLDKCSLDTFRFLINLLSSKTTNRTTWKKKIKETDRHVRG